MRLDIPFQKQEMRNVSEFISHFILFGEVQGSCIYVASSIIEVEVDAIEATLPFHRLSSLFLSE
jgi:hypothetical protein